MILLDTHVLVWLEFPHDPADRLIAATARAEGITLITRDERIRQSFFLKALWWRLEIYHTVLPTRDPAARIPRGD